MTSWVITISKDYPQHWDYAKKHGLWDMPKNFPVRSGDLVYFRLARGDLLGQTVATSGARPMTAADAVPWDDGRDPYTTRFTFDLLSDRPLVSEPWGVTAAKLSKSPVMQVPRSWTDPADEAVLASYFPPAVEPSPWESLVGTFLASPEEDVPTDVLDLSDDEKKVVLTLQRVREGQQKFRSTLVGSYGACAVTGTTVEAALDAAHIRPYSGPKANVVQNGIVLRGDIHRLFDRHRLTIVFLDRGYQVRVHPSLRETPYGALDREPLARLPRDSRDHPDPTLLKEHNDQCRDWLEL